MRRDQILDETIRLIGQRGYYGLTIQEVAKRCGLSNAGLLYYFPSKEHLLAAVLEDFEHRVTEIITPLFERATQRTSPPEAARVATIELLRAIIESGAERPELVRLYNVLQSESLEPSHPAHQSFRAREAKTLKLLTKVIKPHVADPHSAARRLLALMDGLGQQWIRAGQSFDIVEEWTRAIDAFLPAISTSKRTTRK